MGGWLFTLEITLAIEHKDITDAERHEPKGASTATDRQVLTSSGDGTTEFIKVSFNDLLNIPTSVSYINVTSGVSTATSQQPSATNTPLQIEFGSGSTTTDVTISSVGAITFNTAGQYMLNVFLQLGRATETGNSILLTRFLKNGIQIFNTIGNTFADLQYLTPLVLVFPITVSAGDIITCEIMRDSTGNNSGGLFATTPAASGWNSSPSAYVSISKFAGL